MANRISSDGRNGIEPEKNATVVFRAKIEIEHGVTRVLLALAAKFGATGLVEVMLAEGVPSDLALLAFLDQSEE